MKFTHSSRLTTPVLSPVARPDACKTPVSSLPGLTSPIVGSILRPKLYFVKVDVQACFDTIEQSKLLQILRDVLSEVCHASISWTLPFYNLLQDNYVLPRFGQVMQAAGRVKRKFAMKALPDGQLLCFGLRNPTM
jgi:hypothetical protein